MRKLLFIMVALAAALLVIATGTDGENASANLQQANVSIGDNFYNPETITVNAGTTVVWVNNGGANHTVSSDTGVFDSGIAPADLLSSGETFSFTFTAPGTYPYFCYLHGAAGGIGQAGTVIVQQVATPTPTATIGPHRQPDDPTVWPRCDAISERCGYASAPGSPPLRAAWAANRVAARA